MAEAFADIVNDLEAAVSFLNGMQTDAATASTGALALAKAARDTITGEIAQPAKDGIASALSSLADAISADRAASILGPIVRELASTSEIDDPASDLDGAFEAVYDYFRDTPRHVKLSAHTFDTSATAGGANVGSGTMYRLTVDEDGNQLEGLDPDTYTIKCVVDARTSGRAHDETFEISGTDGRDDNLDQLGTNLSGVRFFGATGARESVLLNPSFDEASFSGSTISAMAGWRTQTDGDSAAPNSNVEIDDGVYFRIVPGKSATNSKGLKFTADEILYQDLVKNNRRISYNEPYLIAIRVRRNSTSTGNAILRLSGTLGSGGVSTTLDISTLSADTWGTVIIAMGANCWPKAWNSNDLKFQIEAGSLTGSFTVDDCTFVPMFRFGAVLGRRAGRGALGQYVAYLGGATPAVKDDSWEFGDTSSTRGQANFWLMRGGIGYLPAVADSTQITASGGRTMTFADADPDTITFSSGDLTADGFEAGMKVTIAGTSSNNGTYVIASVTSTVITLESGETLAAEGPLSSTATAQATAYVDK